MSDKPEQPKNPNAPTLPALCARCGRLLSYPEGSVVTGLSVVINNIDEGDMGKHVREQLGEFYQGGDRFEIHFCYKCFLNAYFH